MPPPPLHICTALQQYAEDLDLCDREVVFEEELPPLRGRALVAAVAALGRALPLRPGDRCALLGETSTAYLVALLATLDAGSVACPLNWRWSARELAAALGAVAPRVALCDASLLPLLEQALAAAGDLLLPNPPAIFVLSSSGQELDDSLRVAARRATTTTAALAAAAMRGSGPSSPPALQLSFAPPSSPFTSPSSPDALCVFTSGTTAAPKPVRLSHAALWHQTRAKISAVGYARDDCYLHLAPLFHIGGLSSAHAALAAGALGHVLLRRFSARGAALAVRRHRVTAAICVPTMLADLLDAAAAEEESGQKRRATTPPPLASLRRLLVGGGAPSPALLARCLRELPAKCRLMGAYGMTEACSSMTFADLRKAQPRAPRAGAAFAGWAGPGIELAIAEVVGGASSRPSLRLASPGAVGEVITRGPHVMTGYYVPQVDPKRAAEADAAALVVGVVAGSGGGAPHPSSSTSAWLRTGDAGLLDPVSGALFLCGRLKECVRSGGENVFAPEVEAALCLHPAVASAAVVGVLHARLGEAVAAAVVLKPGWLWRGGADALLVKEEEAAAASTEVVSAAGLRAFCVADGGDGGAGLSRFKAPRAIVAVRELPRDPLTGKLARAAVREAVVGAMGGGAAAAKEEQDAGGRRTLPTTGARSRL